MIRENFILFRETFSYLEITFSHSQTFLFTEKFYFIQRNIFIFRESFIAIRDTFSYLDNFFYIQKNLVYSEKLYI